MSRGRGGFQEGLSALPCGSRLSETIHEAASRRAETVPRAMRFGGAVSARRLGIPPKAPGDKRRFTAAVKEVGKESKSQAAKKPV